MRSYNIPFRYFFFAVSIGLLGGCSSNTSTNSDQSTVVMQSSFTASSVSQAMPAKGAVPSVLDIDSIVVTRALVFVKDVKLHSDVDDTAKDDHDANLKTGPFVLVFDSTGVHGVTTTTIPPATYDRIKFEIHKPDKNDSQDAAILASYPELQVNNQTYTVYITGYTMKAGVRSYFAVRSNASRNITIHFEDHDLKDKDNVQFVANTTSTLNFQFDPRLVFHLLGQIGGTLFNPNDSTHQGDIDDHVLIAIRVILM